MDCVKVALRIRPLVTSELDIGCRPCIERIPKEPQVTIGKGSQMFTYNFVFDEFEGQGKVYNDAVESLIDNLFKGYNVTILAYGQTGSGKTYTMGTNYSGDGELGVIPRAIYDIFNKINSSTDKEYKVSVSFIELYNESLYDLLTQKPREQSIVEMREHCNTVCIPGLTELEVRSPEETLGRLKEGSSGRVVGSTAMNAQSSRSHAIFTINFKILPKDNPTNIITSKFHLVDLAGSERSKKTGTTGERFKEGVNINKGLLVLGNVISQLGEGNHGYINYRDSKLTRLLQDSLGGNSVTLMIACVSPADYNQDETLSTLRYADRARKIKNKPVVNQDPHLAEISRLRKEIEELRLKMIGGTILECPPEHKTLQEKLSEAQRKINQLSKALGSALSQNTTMFEKTISIENAETTLKEKLNELFSYLTGTLSADDQRWVELKEKIATVQDEQKKVEKEILGLDKSSEHNNDEKDDDDNDDGDDEGDAASGLINRREEHIMSQAKINKEILALSKDLMWKEELMAKLSENSGQFGRINGVSEESVEELKRQLAELQQEKDDLLKQMKSSSSGQSASAKIAENRRKRLQELESKVSSLTKKVTEQERVIKMKEKSEEKIMALKQEIMSMKQLKVKLIQQMKTENERFSNFKAEKDREVCQLKSQNMKKLNQMKKMEQLHSMQQNVLRRKLEAAAAANKRIMAALERQKNARERKNKGPASEKIKERLTEELELLESEYQAQKSLETLIQDRASLTKELAVIKESLEDDSVSEAEKVKLRIDAKQVENELDMRSVEISDLQQKLLDIQQDDQNKHYLEVLQSMADAKFALKYLFNLASERVKESVNYAAALAELKEQQSETDLQLSEYRTKLENLESYHKKALERMEKECEEKVYLFMKMASENIEKNQDGPLSEKFRIQTQELEKLEQLRKRIEELEEENKRLAMDGSNQMETENLNPFEKFLEERNTTFIVPSKKRTMKKEKKVENYAVTDEETLRAFDDSGEIDIDDPENDPDWRKTPIARRIHALRKGKLGKRNSGKEDEKCTCIGKCEKGCICKKSASPCNENCSCDHSVCSSANKRLRIDFGED